MNFKTTLVLLVLLVVVSSFYFFVESTATEPGGQTGEQSRSGQALFADGKLASSAVQKITIDFQGQPGPIQIVRDGTDWKQTTPVAFALESWSASQLVDAAGGLRHVESFKVGSKSAGPLSQMGLDPPMVVVTFDLDKTASAPQCSIKLGNKLALGQRAYAMIDDKTVYVVGDELHKKVLDEKVEALRKKNLEAPSGGQVDRLTLLRDGQEIQLVKSDGNWAFAGSHSGRAGRNAVEQLVTDIGSIYISKFIEDQPRKLSIYGLDDPPTHLTVHVPAPPPADENEPQDASGQDAEGAAAQSKTLRIGAPTGFGKDDYFATWSDTSDAEPVVFTISKYHKEKFDKTVNDLRDLRISPIASDDVRQLTCQTPEHGTIKLAQGDAGWAYAMEPNPAYSADDQATSDLVKAVTGATAEEFIPDGRPQTDPIATVTIGAMGRPDPDVLNIYGLEDPKKLLVLRNNETTGYQVARDALAGVMEPVWSLRDRRVLDVAPARLDRIVLARPDGTEFLFDREFIAPPAAQDSSGSQDSPAANSAEGEPSTETDGPGESEGDAADSDTGPDEAVAPQPGPWRLVGHDAFDRDAFDTLIGELTPLKATRWWPEPLEPAAGVDRLQVHTIGSEPITVTIDPSSRLASATGLDMSFQVSQAFVDVVDTEMRTRTVLPLSTAQIQFVRVTRDGRTLTLRRDDDGDYTGAQDEPINQSAAADLFDTLAGLRVDRYLSGGDGQDASAPIRIEVVLKDKTRHELTLASASDPKRVVTLDGKSYHLSQEVFVKLTASLILPGQVT